MKGISSATINGEARLTIGDFIIPPLDNVVKFEKPSGEMNRVNKVFNLANTPVNGTLIVFHNGLLQEPGEDNDYIIDGNIITLSSPPFQGDKLLAFYYFL